MTPLKYGTSHFVSFTKACDYYRDQGNDDLTPAELERAVREKISEGEISIGKPDVPVNSKLILWDNGTRYAIEEGEEMSGLEKRRLKGEGWGEE